MSLTGGINEVAARLFSICCVKLMVMVGSVMCYCDLYKADERTA